MQDSSQPPIRFAVILPTYNRPDYLIASIQSVLAQTYPHWLLIISNDCSTVDYRAVAPWLSDPRIHYIVRDTNGGCNAARNTAIDAAMNLDADYLALMGDDETLDPQCIETAVGVIGQHPDIGWFMSNTAGATKPSSHRITREGVYDWLDDYVYGKALRGDKTHIISTRALGGIRFDGRYRASNMWPFHMRLAQRTKIYAYTYPSKNIDYLSDGITKNASRYPRSWREIYSRFARHALAIRIRPWKLKAYKYLLLELLKTPKRAVLLMTRGQCGQRPAS
jgi:glycosyltransferase involved in cell wall biosynthesis